MPGSLGPYSWVSARPLGHRQGPLPSGDIDFQLPRSWRDNTQMVCDVAGQAGERGLGWGLGRTSETGGQTGCLGLSGASWGHSPWLSVPSGAWQQGIEGLAGAEL